MRRMIRRQRSSRGTRSHFVNTNWKRAVVICSSSLINRKSICLRPCLASRSKNMRFNDSRWDKYVRVCICKHHKGAAEKGGIRTMVLCNCVVRVGRRKKKLATHTHTHTHTRTHTCIHTGAHQHKDTGTNTSLGCDLKQTLTVSCHCF